MSNTLLIITVLAALVLLIAAAVFIGVRRAKKRRNYNPNDVYPLW